MLAVTSRATKSQKLNVISHIISTPIGTNNQVVKKIKNITVATIIIDQISEPVMKMTELKNNLSPSHTGVNIPQVPHTPGPIRFPA